MPDIRENLESLIDENTSRAVLDKIAVIKNQLDEMDAKSAKQDADYKDLLKDYTNLVKTSVFKVDSQTKVDEGKKADFSFDSFLADWTEKSKKL